MRPSSASASPAWSRARWRRTSAWVSVSFSWLILACSSASCWAHVRSSSGDVLAGLAIGGQRLVEARQPLARSLAVTSSSAAITLATAGTSSVSRAIARAHPLQALRALGPLALRALEHPALGGQLGASWARRHRLRPVVGRGAAALDRAP